MTGNTHTRVGPDVLGMIGNTHAWVRLDVSDMIGNTHIWAGLDVLDMNSGHSHLGRTTRFDMNSIIIIVIIIIMIIIMDNSSAPSRVSPRRLQKRLRTYEEEEVGRHTEQCAH